MTDVVSMLERARIEVRESGANVGAGWIGIDCVFCGETRKHLGINRDEGFFNCWVCGARGSWWKIARRLRELYPSTPWHEVDVGPATRYLDVEYEKLRPELDASTAPFSTWDPEAMTDYEFSLYDYLTDERALDPDLVALLEPLVGLNGPKDGDAQLRGYVCFRYGDDVVARKIGDLYRGPRWWRSFGGAALWGLEYLHSEPEWIVLCEGVFDALACPLGRGVAVLGSVASQQWIGLLAEALPRSCRDVVVAFDSNVSPGSKTIQKIRLELGDLGLRSHVWDWDDGRFDRLWDTREDWDLDELRREFGNDPGDDEILDYCLELVGVLDGDLDRPLL